MSGSQPRHGRLELIGHKTFAPYDQMYKVVDFLNKTLKDRELIFGLTLEKDERMAISVYSTAAHGDD